MINGMEKECTLFVKENEIRLRVGNREYAVIGTPTSFTIPFTSKSVQVLVPFSPTLVEAAQGKVKLESEEGMTAATIDAPNLAKGTVVIDENALAESLSNFECRSDGNLSMSVMRGGVDIQNKNVSGAALRFEYKDTPFVLCLREVRPEIR